MYHPDMMMNIAHKREAELIRDAQQCGVPQSDGNNHKAYRPQLTMALLCAVPLVILFVWAVVHV